MLLGGSAALVASPCASPVLASLLAVLAADMESMGQLPVVLYYWLTALGIRPQLYLLEQ